MMWDNLRKRLIDESETCNCMAHFGYHSYFLEREPIEESPVRVSTIDYILVPKQSFTKTIELIRSLRLI
jgi:hypothetical protein